MSQSGAVAGDASGQNFDAILGLGSNVGDREINIATAVKLLTADGALAVAAHSHLYRTEPWGVTEQDWFLNACVGIRTKLDSKALLARCQAVEKSMGRVRLRRWGPRNIDVDILVMGEQNIDLPDLTVPHPRIAERAFVLVPLKDVAPNLVVRGKTLDEMLAKVDRDEVTRYPG